MLQELYCYFTINIGTLHLFITESGLLPLKYLFIG
ncbi:uncharacterized protein METZ01_LOCUS203802, partial [marine metagenome]